MTPRRLLGRTIPLVLAVAAVGCGFQPTPIALDKSVDPWSIDEIVVLPVIDARTSQFDQVQVARNVGDAMVRLLRERGYFTLAADAFGQRPSGPLDLHVAGPDQLVPLAPADANTFILVQVEKLEPGMDGSIPTYDARLSAVMVDKAHNRVLWRDVEKGTSTLNGMLTVFSRGSRQYEAAVNACRALVDTLPGKHPHNPKR